MLLSTRAQAAQDYEALYRLGHSQPGWDDVWSQPPVLRKPEAPKQILEKNGEMVLSTGMFFVVWTIAEHMKMKMFKHTSIITIDVWRIKNINLIA